MWSTLCCKHFYSLSHLINKLRLEQEVPIYSQKFPPPPSPSPCPDTHIQIQVLKDINGGSPLHLCTFCDLLFEQLSYPNMMSQKVLCPFFQSLCNKQFSISLLDVFSQGPQMKMVQKGQNMKEKHMQPQPQRWPREDRGHTPCYFQLLSGIFLLLCLFIVPSHLQAARALCIHHLIVLGTSDIAEFRNQCLALDSHGLVLWGHPRTQCTDTIECLLSKSQPPLCLLTPSQWDEMSLMGRESQ